MQYLGSKNKIAKHLLPTMLSHRKLGQWWVEPFVGGANMIDKVDGPRVGNDVHRHLIAMLEALQEGWIPPTEVSRDMYYRVKNSQEDYSNELVGFVGFLCSFGGKWWGGYASNSAGNNYAARGSRVLVKQAKKLIGVRFTRGSYLDMAIPPGSLIYCDPPYRGTTGYKGGFDHERFWSWCRDRVKDGHMLFVSEYTAPDDFVCVKKVTHETILDRNRRRERVERLFVWPDVSSYSGGINLV